MRIKHFAAELSPDMDGQRVRVAGWVVRVRDLGKICFVILRDSTGEVQLTFKKGVVPDNLLQLAKKLNLMSAVIAEGVVRKAKTKYGFEVIPEKVEVNPADSNLPIDVTGHTETELSKRIKYRVLDLRRPHVAAIFRVRSVVVNAFREFLLSRGFVEIHTPCIGLYSAEGGANVFEVKYFDRRAYLRQSPQLYKQLMAACLERVFEVGPAWRAEPHWTTRHLCEFTSLDVEVAWIDGIEPLLDLVEDLLIYIIKKVRERARKEFELLGVPLPEVPNKPFPRLEYREAVRLLKQAGIRLEGKEIPASGEQWLAKYVEEKYGQEFFHITHFPYDVRPFYTMKEVIDGEILTRSFDTIYRGCEIISGAQREHRYEVLRKQMLEKGLRPESFGYYLEAFKYGMPPHGGFGLGLDRLVQLLLRLPNVREAVLFPRDPMTLEP